MQRARQEVSSAQESAGGRRQWRGMRRRDAGIGSSGNCRKDRENELTNAAVPDALSGELRDDSARDEQGDGGDGEREIELGGSGEVGDQRDDRADREREERRDRGDHR